MVAAVSAASVVRGSTRRSSRSMVADINLLERCAGFAPHARGCEGWYACTCWVGRAEKAAGRLRLDARALTTTDAPAAVSELALPVSLTSDPEVPR